MHLLLVISSLGCGGAERVMSRMAQAWASTGVEITLATFDGRQGDFFKLPSGVRRRSMQDECSGQRSWLPGPFRRARWLRSVIQDVAPDAVISFIDRTNVVTLWAAQGLGKPVIISERTDPLMSRPGAIWSMLRRLTYFLSSAIVFQTEGNADWSRQRFPRNRTVVIANPAPDLALQERGSSASEIIAVGRLVHLKGFDLLIEAFGRIANRWPEWRLRILGEGGLRAELEKQVAAGGLMDRVMLPGQQANAIEQIANASIFVLSSRYEGFPNVLVEAMATGRAVVATDCRSGPADLIETGVNGILVSPENSEALASALEHLIATPHDRLRMGMAAKSIRDKLSMENILSQWNALLADCGVPVVSQSNLQSRAA